MQLNKILIALQPRSPWQAIDLGLQMARAWWLSLTLAALLVSLPLFGLAQWLLVDADWLYLLLWWAKPLWEVPVVLVLGKRLFNQPLHWRSFARALPSILNWQMLAQLTLRRFSSTRAMDYPVTYLEGLVGEARRSRLDVLHLHNRVPAFWLWAVFYAIESVLVFGIAFFVMQLLPANMLETIGWGQWLSLGSFFNAGWIASTMSYLAMLLVAPFYVAAGFALYIQRRIELEGWDIELMFKQINQRLASGATNAD